MNARVHHVAGAVFAPVLSLQAESRLCTNENRSAVRFRDDKLNLKAERELILDRIESGIAVSKKIYIYNLVDNSLQRTRSRDTNNVLVGMQARAFLRRVRVINGAQTREGTSYHAIKKMRKP